mmetsp:Transcript_591/g.977  ORF Transcript_591/g.977 Transcript_591/m.977 type:complete len:98 (-) Transcript_591:194-487(-)
MGESVSRSMQACWDPEGTAAIVRKKKAQRAAINRYDEELKALETDGGESARGKILALDREYKQKGEGEFKGKFWRELQEHADWSGILQRRQNLNVGL